MFHQYSKRRSKKRKGKVKTIFHQFLIYTSLFFFIAFLGLFFSLFIIILINDAKYEEVYRLYQEKFGSNMSPMVNNYRYLGKYSSFSKIIPFGSVLLLKKDSWFIRDFPQSHYDYIRSLPKKLNTLDGNYDILNLLFFGFYSCVTYFYVFYGLFYVAFKNSIGLYNKFF